MKNSIPVCMGLALTLIAVGSGCGDSAEAGLGGAGGSLDGGGGADDGGGGADDGTCSCAFNPGIPGYTEADTCLCIDETNKGDVDDIIACTATTTCTPTQVYEEEGIELSDPNNVCLLERLRDRAAGRLSHSTDVVSGSGATYIGHHLVIHEDGTVIRASEISNNNDDEDESVKDYTAAEQCVLKPATYFDDCLTALANDDTAVAEACLFGDAGIDQWFDSCSVQAPVCR